MVYAATTAEVVEAVCFAREENLPLSVRDAGHHIGGACVAEAGIVIDTSALKELLVDAATQTAKAGAGLTTGEFVRPLHEQGFIVPTGSHDSVGLAGITLSGGLGILMGKYGLVCDSLLSAEVVTAEGKVLTASSTEHPNLLWALRGGGGNFGVVASLTFRLYPLEPTIAGIVLHPNLCLLDALKDHDPAGHHYAFASRGLPVLTDELLEVIAERAEAVSSPGSAVVLYHLHRIAARVAPDATAFAAREVPYFLGA